MSGRKAIDWSRAQEARRKSEAREVIDERRVSGWAALGAIENQNDRKWLADILTEELLTPGMRKQLEHSIAWLEGNPTRDLAPGYREKFQRYERAIHAARKRVAHGEPAFLNNDAKPRYFARGPARAPLPDWMRDPSLLPKRPPGHA